MAEVVLCEAHEPDFLYWYREAGGDQYRGSEDLQDAFFTWFEDGGRAPTEYGGLEHVETAPEDLPEPEIDQAAATVDLAESEERRIDLRDIDLDKDYPS